MSLPDAVLGGKVAAPTPDGPVSLKVPKGSNTGAVLRLKGRGLTDHKTGKRGDLLARLVVTLPDAPDPKLDAFAEEMRRERPYSPSAALTVVAGAHALLGDIRRTTYLFAGSVRRLSPSSRSAPAARNRDAPAVGAEMTARATREGMRDATAPTARLQWLAADEARPACAGRISR